VTGGLKHFLAAGVSALGLLGAGPAFAADAAQDQPVAAPQQSGPRLNPTSREVLLTVPLKDGANYLGDIPLTIGADDSISFPTDRALQLLSLVLDSGVLQSLKGSIGNKAAITPQDLAPAGIVAQYDAQNLELRFQIPVERRASRSLSVSALDRVQIGDVVQPQDVSAYVNIRGSVDLVESGLDTGFQNPVFLLDGAVRLGGLVAESDAVWSPGSLGADFQRLGSRLVYDDIGSLIRFTGGDLETQARGFQAAPDIAGISLFRSYSVLNPQQIIRPRGDRTFRLDRPSQVEVYVNGQQVRRIQLNPGNYDLRDFPFAQGANDIRLNILDDSGRNEVVRFNIFLDQTQLAKGLSEFGLYAGVKAPLGLKGPNYTDEWIVSGYYRRGINDYLTLGVNFQADERSRMAGVEAVFGTSIGTFGSNASVSHIDGVGTGYAFQATFQRLIQRGNGRNDSLNLFFETRSRLFAPVAYYLPDNPYEFEVGGGYSHAFSDAFYAGFDGRYSKGRGLRPDVHNYRITAGWRLSDRTTLNAEARYQQDSLGEDVSAFISLTVRLGRYSSVRSEYDSRDNRARVSYQTLHGSGVGSYNITGDVERSDFGSGINLNANYITNRAELGISHNGIFNGDFGSSTSQRTTFRLGTSIAFAGDSLSIGRPIYDSFAIVKPHRSLGKADVIVEPSSFGYTANTGALGVATMPSLSSYSERTIPVDVENAKPGTDIGQGSFRLTPPYRSGYLLQVGSDYNVTALGTMLNADGEPIALVTGSAVELAHPERPAVTIFTNRQGRFGASSLAPGQWRVTMNDDRKSVYILDVPATTEGILRVGEIKPKEGN
jgi:outer membrane usher protein